MSKAFTKEEDGGEPAIVPPRAPLPPGVPNYVTVHGLSRLREEWARLEEERAQVNTGGEGDGHGDGGNIGADRSRRLAFLHERIGALAARIGSAQLVDVPAEPPSEVRFGTTVTVRATVSGEVRRFTVVGVDEANAAHGRVAFVSPIAQALLGRAMGDVVTVRAGRGDEELVVETIAYE